MIRAVLDVNVLASSSLNLHGLPARVVDMALESMFELVVSDHIIETIMVVLERPYFVDHLSEEGRDRLIRALHMDLDPVEPDKSVRGITADLEDDLVLGTAVAANADYLVTGDKGLLKIGEHRGVRIVTAADFLVELEKP